MYKQDFDHLTRRANQDIRPRDHLFINPHEGGTSKPGKHSLGQYAVLSRTEISFLIEREPVVERVNSDQVTHAPAPTYDKASEPDVLLEDTTSNVRNKNRDLLAWLVDRILAHRVHKNVIKEFLVDWNGPYEETLEKRTIVPG